MDLLSLSLSMADATNRMRVLHTFAIDGDVRQILLSDGHMNWRSSADGLVSPGRSSPARAETTAALRAASGFTPCRTHPESDEALGPPAEPRLPAVSPADVVSQPFASVSARAIRGPED